MFVVMKLGCGWECWLNDTGAVAKRLGKKVHLIGVEGDERRAALAIESTALSASEAPDRYPQPYRRRWLNRDP